MATSIKYKGWKLDADRSYLAALFNSTEVFRITASSLTLAQPLSPTTSDGAALGTSSLMWSDLFLADGAVINFNNGDITITHSTDKLAVAATWTTAEATGRPFAVNLTTNVSLGSYANAFKANADLQSVGGATGLFSAACFEIAMPTTGIAGTTAAVEYELTYGATCGALQKPCFIYANASGTAVTDFDTYGKFLILGTGVTAGAGKFLSANSQTLKCGFGALGGTIRYLFFSQNENGIGIGNSTTANSYTAGTPPIALYFTCSSTTSTNAEPFYLKSIMTGTGGYAGRSRFHLYTEAALTTNVMALKALTEFGVGAGRCTGLATAFCAEMTMPSITLTTGSYTCLELEMVCPANLTSLASIPTSFILCSLSGTRADMFNASGYLFDINGVTATSSGFFYLADLTVTKADGLLKCSINGADYYIFITTTINGG